jgi:hypothetical protein
MRPVAELEPGTLPPHHAQTRGETVRPQPEPRVERRLAAIFAADVSFTGLYVRVTPKR